MLQAPSNHLFVEITSKYSDELLFKSGVKLYVDPSFNPNFHATSEGIVHSIPKCWRDDLKDERMDIRVGDTAIFGYKTVGDITFQDGTDLFRMTTTEEGWVTEWMNAERFTLRLMAGVEKYKWVALYLDQRLNLIEGKVGHQGECENWLAQNFRFADGEGFKFDNRVYYKDKELWRVDGRYVFGYRRDGHLHMVSDYLMVEPIIEDLPKLMLLGSELVRPESHKFCIRENKGWLRAGEKMGLKNGDVLYFCPDMKEKYNIAGIPSYILRRRWVLGVESPLEFGQPIGLN